jgi:hypothetical protein
MNPVVMAMLALAAIRDSSEQENCNKLTHIWFDAKKRLTPEEIESYYDARDLFDSIDTFAFFACRD